MGLRVLIVDDDNLLRCIMRSNLESQGFTVEDAENGAIAIKMAARRKYDLILLDLAMPGLNGFEATREIRSYPAHSATPIVVITGMEDHTSIDRAFELGATHFVTKPINWDLLNHVLRFVLRASDHEKELRAAKEQAEAGTLAKSVFLATMSHELKTPLNAIIGFSDMIAMEHLGPISEPAYRDYANEVSTAGRALLRLVSDILLISKCETEQIKTDQSQLAVDELIENAVWRVNGENEETGVQVETQGSLPDLILVCDGKRILQALHKVLHNAVRFSEKGTAVTISADGMPETGLIITIADRGIGIPNERLDDIARPFQQVDFTLARRFEGAGLGLPIARAIVHAHGGELTIESEVGEGTTVTITLPPRRLTAAVSWATA